MNNRQSIYIDGFKHRNPVPAACRKGNFLVSGIVTGVDPQNGRMPTTLEEQCAHMFDHVRSIIEKGGGTTADIIKVTIWMTDRSNREAVNQEWLKMFPDPDNRPTRQAMEIALDGGKLVACDFVAIIS